MRRSALPTLLLLTALGLLLAACKPSDRSASSGGGWEVAMAMVDAPLRIGPGVVEIRPLFEGAAVEGARVSVVAEMTHAGMGAPQQVQAAEVAAGVYRSEAIDFSMAGDWVLSATVLTQDGRRREAMLLLQVGR